MQVVPEEAETVRLIFNKYLELGSVQRLAACLEEQNIRPKARVLSNGRTLQARRYMVGALAYMLRNRFYVGEIVYRGDVHKGEHEPIIDRVLFEAVQMRMQEQRVTRSIRRDSSRAILTGRIFDDACHPMSPSHTNKRGVRYRYYVSQALVQGEKQRAGSVKRVSAPDMEEAVCGALRKYRPDLSDLDDRALVEQSGARIVVTSSSITIELESHQDEPIAIDLPFIVRGTARKGYVHQPQSQPPMSAETTDALLKAIARARGWLDEVVTGKASSFQEIASREGLMERHVRFLMPLAFVTPQVIEAIADGAAPADLTVTRLAKALPHKWTDQVSAILGG